jgi:hypothetical protein
VNLSNGYCNCCAANVPLLRDNNLGESICSVCRSYDITRVRVTREELRLQRLHDLANIFETVFEVRP